MNSIIQYMNNKAPGYAHPKIDSYFYWGESTCILHKRAVADAAVSSSRLNLLGISYWPLHVLPCTPAVWNPDSVDTRGLLATNWRGISWNRVDLLSKGLGLNPWCVCALARQTVLWLRHQRCQMPVSHLVKLQDLTRFSWSPQVSRPRPWQRLRTERFQQTCSWRRRAGGAKQIRSCGCGSRHGGCATPCKA
jgi:hypothetical protein